MPVPGLLRRCNPGNRLLFANRYALAVGLGRVRNKKETGCRSISPIP